MSGIEPEVQVTNPATGAVVFPRGNTRAHLVDPTPNRHGDLTVRITPSFRMGLAYDLATYPPSWISTMTTSRDPKDLAVALGVPVQSVEDAEAYLDEMLASKRSKR